MSLFEIKENFSAPGISLGIFSNLVVSRWNLLDQRTVDAPNLNAFKNGLSRIRDNRMGFFPSSRTRSAKP